MYKLAHYLNSLFYNDLLNFRFLHAAPVPGLNWRAGHRAIRTINTAIARLWFQDFAAGRAIVEPLAGVGWRRFNGLMPAVGAGDF